MKRYSTYFMMLAIALLSFSFASCEVDWYEDNYHDGYYTDELDALDLAEVLSGTWAGSMQFKNGETNETFSWDVSMTFVQNNRYATKGTGVEVDYDGDVSQSLEFNWYLDERNGDIYITYVGSGKTFVMDANARKYGYSLKENDYWLPGYASFMAKKEKRPADFFCFLQYEFFTQWWKLRQYANQKGLEIIGDIPIYVSGDSSDVESDPKLFQLDSEGHPTRVAGCPPDAFSDDGQLWGNPLYDWDYHEKTGFQWWILRMKHCFKLYDVVRVDHFRGFDEYYSIPAGDKTARNGKWMPGPGLKLFEAIEKEIPGAKIIAEDLGFLTDSVKQLVKDTGYPGMKLFEFSFDSRDKESMTPDQWPAHSIGYTGTHDNQTLKAWFLEISKEDRKMVAKYFHTTVLKLAHSDYVGRFLDETLGSAPETVVIPMADYCKFGKEARINFPSTLGKNWTFRFLSSDFTDALQKDILARTEKSGRV